MSNDQQARGSGATTDTESGLAFGELVVSHSAQLHRYCRKFACDRDDEEDMVQSTWVAAWELRRQYRGDGAFGGWLLRLARTICLGNLRRRLPTTGAESVVNLAAPEPIDLAEAIADQEFEERRLALVLELPPGQRLVLLGRLCAGWSTQETAAILGCKTGTVKATLHQAKRSLARAVSSGKSPRDIVNRRRAGAEIRQRL